MEYTEVKESYRKDKEVDKGEVKLTEEVEDIKYPLLILKVDEIESFRLRVLKGLLEGRSRIHEEDKYYVYIDSGGQINEVGVLSKKRLKVVLYSTTFKVFEKAVYLEEGVRIDGDLLFALCEPTI